MLLITIELINHLSLFSVFFFAGSCGSCWAFSAVGSFEGAYAIKTGNLVSLSEQQAIDCTYSSEPGRKGCDGGWMDDAFHYWIEKVGACRTVDYPQSQALDHVCSMQDSFPTVKMARAWTVAPGDPGGMASILQDNAPLSTAIDANGLRLYMSGTIGDLKSIGTAAPTCMKNYNSMNHAVTFIGYGTEPQKILGIETGQKLKYWIAKNSWGEG